MHKLTPPLVIGILVFAVAVTAILTSIRCRCKYQKDFPNRLEICVMILLVNAAFIFGIFVAEMMRRAS